MKSEKRPVADIEDEGIELRPDGWQRFREAVHAAAKSGRKSAAKISLPRGESQPTARGKPRGTSSV